MNRNTIRVTTVGAALGVAAIFAPAAASAAPGDWVSPTNCAKVATPSNPAGWGNTFPDEAGRAGEIVTTTVVDDDGSLEFNTTEELKRKASYHEAGGLPLAELVDKKGGATVGSPSRSLKARPTGRSASPARTPAPGTVS
ncbi:Uncharacterised protein [Gordonia paraffinivorans]|uniref:Uncharacterized protein n=2 Tax=Gordonia paraffinivorans TaxID=175628 RepID=A0ABD7V3V0_9ACTN|nr:Uncharacterised protein [Gordonia paraffinivorans]